MRPTYEGFDNIFTFTVWANIRNSSKRNKRWLLKARDIDHKGMLTTDKKIEWLAELISVSMGKRMSKMRFEHDCPVYYLLCTAMQHVNWNEIAQSFLELSKTDLPDVKTPA